MNHVTKQQSSSWVSRARKTPVFLVPCFLLMLGNRCQPERAMNDTAQNTDALLSIALQDGFEGVPVIVRVNAKEVYNQKSVQTDYRISLAASFEVPLPVSPIVVEVELPQQQVTDTLRLATDTTVYVGISWLEGKLILKSSKIPFGYM
ncbi:MAG: hypothetical protein WA960_21905 [Tunicatimonas sp.]